MKRKMVLILMLTIAVTSFSACGNNINNEETQVTEATESTEALAQQTESAPEFATTSVAYEGDSKYFSGEIQCIQITDGDHEALAKAVDREFSKRIKELNYRVSGLRVFDPFNLPLDFRAVLKLIKQNHLFTEISQVFDIFAFSIGFPVMVIFLISQISIGIFQ